MEAGAGGAPREEALSPFPHLALRISFTQLLPSYVIYDNLVNRPKAKPSNTFPKNGALFLLVQVWSIKYRTLLGSDMVL